ncbi:MAG: hypothetical protein OXD32_04505, partial [Endozoicomonadaceae bacterium]|nr:hypothetical protein [Endozoicomonadaceae bacterium]
MSQRAKWNIVITLLTLLFLNNTAEAMFHPPKGKRPRVVQIQQPRNVSHDTFQRVYISPDVASISQNTKRNVAIGQLDTLSTQWDYSEVNWADLYPYFSEFIKINFYLEITGKQYDTGMTGIIDRLAVAMLDSATSPIKDKQTAKFYVYSILHNMYAYIAEFLSDKHPGYHFFQTAAQALKNTNESAVDTPRTNPEYNPEDWQMMLSNYETFFMGNIELTRTVLNNNTAALLTILNTFAAQLQIPEVDLSYITVQYLDSTPSLLELFEHYKYQYRPLVFAFLVSYHFENELITDRFRRTDYLHAEKNLQKIVAQSFMTLWNSAKSYLECAELAKLAIFVFNMNPLNVKIPAQTQMPWQPGTQTMQQRPKCLPAPPRMVPQQPWMIRPGMMHSLAGNMQTKLTVQEQKPRSIPSASAPSEPVTWDSISPEDAKEAFTTFYADLISAYDHHLFTRLISRGVFRLEIADEIRAARTDRDKNQVIMTQIGAHLNARNIKPFKELVLATMDTPRQYLADNIHEHLG